MVLQPEKGNVVAQRVEEVVLAVVTRPERRAGFPDELRVMLLDLSRHLDRFRAVGRDVDQMTRRDLGRERDRAKVASGDDRRVDERHDRGRLELDDPARLPRDRKRGAVLPSGGKTQARRIDQPLQRDAGRVEEHLVPIQDGQVRGGRGTECESLLLA